jgi:hypothetical protein
VSAWTETDEVALRQAVAAKHRAVEAAWSVERQAARGRERQAALDLGLAAGG